MKITKTLICFACCASFVQSTFAATSYVATLDTASVVSNSPSISGTFGTASFTLNDDGSQLSYAVDFTGLDLEPPGDRVGPSDIDKIHLHAGAVGASGPHVLNIFGLPSEDDADLVVDFANNSLSGIWSNDDALDPEGNPFDPTSSGTTKFLSDFLDELNSGELYLAVHTLGEGGEVAVRGQINVVPEPTGLMLTLGTFGVLCLRKRR